MFSSRIDGQHPLLLAPDRRAVRPRRALVAFVEQLHPRRRRRVAQRLDVVRHLEQIAARRAAVDGLLERVLAVAAGDAAEDCVVGHGRVSGSGLQAPASGACRPPGQLCGSRTRPGVRSLEPGACTTAPPWDHAAPVTPELRRLLDARAEDADRLVNAFRPVRSISARVGADDREAVGGRRERLPVAEQAAPVAVEHLAPSCSAPSRGTRSCRGTRRSPCRPRARARS